MTKADVEEYIQKAKLTDIKHIFMMCENRKRNLLAEQIMIDEEDTSVLRALEEMHSGDVKGEIESCKYLRKRYETTLSIARLAYVQWKRDNSKYR